MPEQAKHTIEAIDIALAKLEAVIAEAEKRREQDAMPADVPDDIPRFRTCHVGW